MPSCWAIKYSTSCAHVVKVKAMNSPGVSDRLAADGTTVIAGTPQEFQAHIKSELPRWAKVVKASGIKPE